MTYGYMAYQYETSPKKLQTEYEPDINPKKNKKTNAIKENKTQTKNKKKNKAKIKAGNHFKVCLYVFIGFSILFSISYRNSLITKSFNEKEKTKEELEILRKENTQLKISIQNSLNLSNVEKIASSKLGMKKIDDSQKVYVNLPKKDYVEPASENVVIVKEKGILQKILDKITNLF